MALKLMYITDQPEIAQIAEAAGVDRIFVDMEYVGKAARQGGMDTVQSHHTISDVAAVRRAITKSELLVRCNPIHEATDTAVSTEEEIDDIIENGADIVMLPFFRTAQEVEYFIRCVGGRAKTMLLVETPESAENIDEILSIQGIDSVHIGLNDLSLGYHKKFMFELLADGTVERLANSIKYRGIPFGFGGIASLGKGMLPSEYVIREHYRLGSGAAILSRSFCNCEIVHDVRVIERIFYEGVKQIRAFESKCVHCSAAEFSDNMREVQRRVKMICEGLK